METIRHNRKQETGRTGRAAGDMTRKNNKAAKQQSKHKNKRNKKNRATAAARTELPDHNDSFHANMHLAHKHICPLSSAGITYILEFSAAVASPGTREMKKEESERKREKCL